MVGSATGGVLPIGPGRNHGIQVVDREPEQSRVIEDEIGVQYPVISLVGAPEDQRVLGAPPLRGRFDPRLRIVHVLVGLLAEGVHRQGVGGQIVRRADEVAVVEELQLDGAVAEHPDDAPFLQADDLKRLGRERPGVVERHPSFFLVIVPSRDVEIRESIETWVDLMEQPAVDHGLISRRAVIRDDAVDADGAKGLSVGHELQLGEQRRVAHDEVGGCLVLEVAAVALARDRYVVPAPLLQGPRGVEDTPFAMPNSPPVNSKPTCGFGVGSAVSTLMVPPIAVRPYSAELGPRITSILLASLIGSATTRASFPEFVWGTPSMSKSVLVNSLPTRGMPRSNTDSNNPSCVAMMAPGTCAIACVRASDHLGESIVARSTVSA